MRLILNGKPLPFAPGDSVLIAMLRAGEHPTGGGCLCLAGDCPHCVATVDGVAYIRTCQTKARPGMIVTSHPPDGRPPLPQDDQLRAEFPAEVKHCDVVVIGQGPSGRRAAADARKNGKQVLTIDVNEGQEAIGIYPGPLVVARTAVSMWHCYPQEEIIVATGAAELQPVFPGTHWQGNLTRRAAEQLHRAGFDLGRVLTVGRPPAEVKALPLEHSLVRVEGENGRLTAAITLDAAGNETRHPAETISYDLGFHPRDALLRMGQGMGVRVVGDAAREFDLPPCPQAGIVCPCTGVSVADLQARWEQGFTEMELMKRATLAGTGTCQGSACLPHLRSFLADRGRELQPPFTARPVTRQLTMAEIAAGGQLQATARTALDREHRRLGAQFERSAGWWRPWHYGDREAEYWAVREGVSIMDVSTLGKMAVSGPDATLLLNRIYPTNVHTIKNGRSRYALMLDERGYVFDDGMIAKIDENHYNLTFTSGGAAHAEMWIRDWATSWDMDVRLMNETHILGAINVSGPLAGNLLDKIGVRPRPRFLHHQQTHFSGITLRIYRLSFTGELSYEIHFPAQDSTRIWRLLLEAGAEWGIRPHGLETLLQLRLEKGHIIVGQDTDFDSTARRIDHEWAVDLRKSAFIGRQAVLRTNEIPLDKKLVGLKMAGKAPPEGAVIWHRGEYAGYVTSSAWSPVLNKGIMLGWLFLQEGQLPEVVEIDDQPAYLSPTPFYDREGKRARD